MDQKRRRYVLLLSVVTAGALLVMLDTPLPILIATTFLVGFMMMILTGSLHIGGSKHPDKKAE
ncbi:MAG TPA: hypothetical protein VE134_06320, partial [Methanomicrobiales archaeon]|nr:hypothetical protein [Methanomicrobiales archaeon]